MELLEALILGALQGVFEWLPVSSEAVNTIVLTQFLGRGSLEAANISIFLHVGTMAAAFVYYREDFLDLLKYLPSYLENLLDGDFMKDGESRLTSFLIVSTFFSSLIGGAIFLGAQAYVENLPTDVLSGIMGAALLLTGLLNLKQEGSGRGYLDADLPTAGFVGVLQGLAVIPGVSRSGSTVFGLLSRDFSGEDAFRLSFLMSVPAIFIANIGLTGLEVFLGLESFTFSPMLLVASVVAFAVGYATIETVLRIAEELRVAYLAFLLAALSFLPLIL